MHVPGTYPDIASKVVHYFTKKTLKDLERTIAYMDPKSIPPFFIVQVLESNLYKNFFALFPLFSCYFDSRKAKSV